MAHKVTVTYEKTFRMEQTYEVSEKEYQQIISDGLCPRKQDLENELIGKIVKRERDVVSPEDLDEETDYRIVDDDKKILVDFY